MRKLTLLSILIFVSSISLLYLCSNSKGLNIPDFNNFDLYNGNFQYTSPTMGKIPIVAWNPCINNKPSIQQLKTFQECGFNCAIYDCSTATIDSVCDIASKVQLPLILGKKFLRGPDALNITKRFENNPIIAGWFIIDEPKFNDLSECQYYYSQIATSSPNKLAYINLPAQIIPLYTGECKTFVSYLDTIQKLIRPSVWSYDFYPIEIRNGEPYCVSKTFYTSLETFMKVSQITKRPFWTYNQSMAFKNQRKECPPTTIPFLRFSNFSSLAYGAQGVVYWTYCQVKSNTREQYLSALVNLDGKRTDAWYAAQRVNQEIHLFTDVFLNCEVKEVRHVGKEFIPNTQQLEGSIGPIEKIQSGDSGVIISCLNNNGKHYIVIVSRDPFQKQNIGIKFSREYAVRLLSPTDTTNGLKIKEQKLKNKIKDTLSPGGYLIFEYAKALPDKGEF